MSESPLHYTGDEPDEPANYQCPFMVGRDCYSMCAVYSRKFSKCAILLIAEGPDLKKRPKR